MLSWILRGLLTGVRTDKYPSQPESQPLRAAPVVNPSALRPVDCQPLADVCPTGAFSCSEGPGGMSLSLDLGKCIFCGLCAESVPSAVRMSNEYELASLRREDLITEFVFEGVAGGR